MKPKRLSRASNFGVNLGNDGIGLVKSSALPRGSHAALLQPLESTSSYLASPLVIPVRR